MEMPDRVGHDGFTSLPPAKRGDTDRIDDLVVEYYPEIRNILYDYLKEHRTIDPAVVGDPSVIGSWKFVPEAMAEKALDRDMTLLFPL